MALVVPTKEPETIQAGVTLTWTKSITDFPAGTWTLTYYLNEDSSAQSGMSFAAAADGIDHLVTVTAATTAGWVPGRYKMLGRVSDGTAKHDVFIGFVEVLPDLAVAGDYRSHAKKVLDAIEAVIITRAGAALVSFNVEGQQFQNISHAELISLRSFYKAEYLAEKAATRASQGLSSPGRILTRFRRPS